MDYESLQSVKSGLGTGAVIVIDKEQDIIRCIARLSHFFKHESCGQCSPCREGCDWLTKIMDRFVDGNFKEAEINMLYELTNKLKAIQFAGDVGMADPGLIRHFRPELEERIGIDLKKYSYI